MLERGIRRRKTSNTKDSIVLALVGNPNVGKSTVFNGLTGMKQHTGNWPGKTVSIAEGEVKRGENTYRLVDLPGTYALNPHSAEEEVTRDFIASNEADGAIVVCDATALERNLNLALQVIALQPHTVVCVNLMDEAKRKKIHVDLNILARELGVPVVGVVAKKKKSLRHLMEAVERAMKEERELPQKAWETRERYRRAEEIVQKAVSVTEKEYAAKDRAWDRILTGKKSGYAIMLFLLALVFWITMEGANVPSELLSRLFFYLEGKLEDVLLFLQVSSSLTALFTQGMFRTLGTVVSVMLPPMAIFFPFFSLLEDVGYLPRIAYNLDRPFQRCCACGKQALTMCMGFGCNAVGVTGARIIDSPRERLLAILTNNFVPCNGRFPTLIAIITMFFVGKTGGVGGSLLGALLLTGVILLGITVTMGITRLLSCTLLKGVPSSFTLELPPYRKPNVGEVVVRSFLDRTLFVLGRAVSVAAPAGLILWLCANVMVGGESVLSHLATFLDPLGQCMGMDGVILLAFLLGFPANEIVLPIILMGYLATGSLGEAESLWEMKEILVANGWTMLTALNVMLFSLFHFPCSTTLWTIKKETGSIKWTLFAALLPTAVGIGLTILLNLITQFFFCCN